MAAEYSGETEPRCCSESAVLICRILSFSSTLTGNQADSGAEEVLMVDGISSCARSVICNLCLAGREL